MTDDENICPRINDVNNLTRRSAEPESPRHFQAQMNDRLKQLEQKSQKLLDYRSNIQRTSDESMVSEVFEETTQQYCSSTNTPKEGGGGTVFPQRRARFHAKGRAPSCSSSDASDDDSEGRKKRRAHRIAASGNGKPLPGRRDSYDDSSDSQDPSCAHGGNNRNRQTTVTNGGPVDSNNGGSGDSGQTTNTSSGNNGKQCGSRRHRSPGNSSGGTHSGRRRSGVETRLRESQSLNRITEVQEPTPPAVHSIVISTTLTAQKIENSNTIKSKGFGARLLQGLSGRRLMMSSEDATASNTAVSVIDNNKENYTSNGKKLRVLGKYFQVHRKLCIPLPGLFQRGRMYKAQSCGSLEPPTPGTMNSSKKGFANGIPLADYNRELNGALVPLVCSVHMVNITECCRMC